MVLTSYQIHSCLKHRRLYDQHQQLAALCVSWYVLYCTHIRTFLSETGWSRVKRGTSVSIERSLCVKGLGGTCAPLFSSLCPSAHLLIWFEAPELFSFPHPPHPVNLCYGIGDEVHMFQLSSALSGRVLLARRNLSSGT
jgi:hypothetical protein